MRRIIYRAVSLLVAASMVSSLFVMPVWAVGTSYGDQYNEAGEFIIDNNKSDSNAITEQGVEKTQNENEALYEFSEEILREGTKTFLDDIRIDFLSQFKFGQLILVVEEWAGFVNEIRGEELDASDFLSVRLLRTMGVPDEKIKELMRAINLHPEFKDELELAESLFAMAILSTHSEKAVEFFFGWLGSLYGKSGGNAGFARTLKNCKENSKTGNSTENKKPNIYFYGFDGELTLDFEAPQYLKDTIPEYDDGWEVNALPDGTLLDEHNNAYQYLFYEFYTQKSYYQTECGFSVPAEQRATRFKELLDEYGFTTEERDDFIEFWTKELEAGVDYIMYPQYTETADLAYPVTVTPKPDTSIRIWFVFMRDHGQEYTQEEIVPFERIGKTMFEWGGMVFD